MKLLPEYRFKSRRHIRADRINDPLCRCSCQFFIFDFLDNYSDVDSDRAFVPRLGPICLINNSEYQDALHHLSVLHLNCSQLQTVQINLSVDIKI